MKKYTKPSLSSCNSYKKTSVIPALAAPLAIMSAATAAAAAAGLVAGAAVTKQVVKASPFESQLLCLDPVK